MNLRKNSDLKEIYWWKYLYKIFIIKNNIIEKCIF